MNRKHLHKQAIEGRRERDKNRRRQEIIDSARDIFLSKGYINTTVDDIALAAGISKITIYRYFKSKDSLCLAVIVPVIEALTGFLQAMEKNIDERKYTSGSELVTDFFQLFHQFYLISPDTFRLIQFFQQTGAVWNLDDNSRLSLSEMAKKNAAISRKIIQSGVDQGLIKNLGTGELWEVLYGAFLGIVQISEIASHKGGVDANPDAREEPLVRRLRLFESIVAGSVVRK